MPADPAKGNSVENSVVKVFTTARRPDVYKPWTKLAPSEMTGSGVVIEGKRILTNAHVVQYYSNPMAMVLKSVNGITIKNLAHLVEVLRDSKDEFLTFKFSNQFCETLVFNRTDALAATEGILTDNGIRCQGSSDTLAVWNGKQKK